MLVSFIPFKFVLIWAIFATVFYYFRYKGVPLLKNKWTLLIIFALNLFFFVIGVFVLLGAEWYKEHTKDDPA